MQVSHRWIAALLSVMGLISIVAVHAASAAGEQHVGVWVGEWEGGGSGGSLQLMLEQADGGGLKGGVEVGQPDGDYKATFSEVTFAGDKMTAKYEFPPEPSAEIVFTGTFGQTGEGTWTMQPKGTSEVFASGTWKVARK